MTFTPALRGITSMVLAMMTFVVNDTFLKIVVAELPPLESLFFRGFVATIWCLVLLAVMGQLPKAHLAFRRWTMLRSLGELLAVTSFVTALAHVPLGEISSIYQVAPLFLLAGASLLWGEHIGILRWLLIGVGVVGALMVAQPGAFGSSPYALLGFVTALGSAGRDLMSRKVHEDAPGMVVALAIILVVTFGSLLGTLVFESPVWPSRQALLASCGAGFFLVFGQFFAFMAFRLASARTVAPFYYTLTIFAVLFGFVFFGEVPNGLAFCGIGLIILCGIGALLLEQAKGKHA